jgi:undecaprenyl-phosphate 4-deoxy-4-formamido-L-arabinose transferase
MSMISSTEGREPEFSVIITCYYEQKSIDEFHARLSAAMESLGRSYEIVFVNDGSTDHTWEKLQAIFHRDTKVRAILDLFKNSGQRAAMAAGVCETSGRALLFMDSDLQLDPGEIPKLVAAWDAGAHVVSGYRTNRKDSFFRILPSVVANMIMRRVSLSDFRDFGCTFKIFDGRLVRAFEFGPQRIFAPVDVIAAAARKTEVPVTHARRKYGKSGWTLRKLMTYNMDNVVQLSDRPFQIMGSVCLLLALLLAARTLVTFFVPFSILGTITPGLLLNTVIVTSLALMAVLCMVGEFTIRAFTAARKVPRYVVHEALRR